VTGLELDGGPREASDLGVMKLRVIGANGGSIQTSGELRMHQP